MTKGNLDINLTINGIKKNLAVERNESLLEMMRRQGYHSVKQGCEAGGCGVCTVLLDGQPVQVRNSQEAQAYGIAAIYQEPLVFPDLNVAENIFISHRDRGPFVRWGKMYEDAEAILAKLDVELDVRMPARGLTLAAQQTVEIAADFNIF